MKELLATSIFAVYNLVGLVLVPWIFTKYIYEKKINIIEEIGIIKVKKSNALMTAVNMLILCAMCTFFASSITSASSVLSVVKGVGFKSIPSIFITSFISIAICQEFAFRGFLFSTLEKMFKTRIANFIQAIGFGLFNIGLYCCFVNFAELLVIFLVTSLIGLYLGCIKKEVANGSILPGIVSVGIAYTIAMWLIAFI